MRPSLETAWIRAATYRYPGRELKCEVGCPDGGCDQANPETVSADYRAGPAGILYRVPAGGGMPIAQSAFKRTVGWGLPCRETRLPSSASGSATVFPHLMAVRTLLPDDPPVGRPRPITIPSGRSIDIEACPGPSGSGRIGFERGGPKAAIASGTAPNSPTYGGCGCRTGCARCRTASGRSRRPNPPTGDAGATKGRIPHGKRRKRRKADIAKRIPGVAPGPPVRQRRATVIHKPYAAFGMSHAKA